MLGSMIETLSQAVEEVNKHIVAGDRDVAVSLLADCQDTAVMIGGAIEESEGEGTATVHLLEEFCEKVYLISVAVGNGEDASTKELGEILDRTGKSLVSEIEAPCNVVFMPYDSSRWDGFETIWAKELSNKGSDPVCLPLKWYEKDSKGHLTAEHHELGGYPDNVKVMDYNIYDITAVKPDIIYVQSVSDSGDLSKVVDKFFYISNLRNYTDKLVFVPYEIVNEVNLNNQDEVENLGKKLYHPALLMVDEIIPQSANVREVYIKMMTNLQGEESHDKWEEIVSRDISPRIERLKSLKKEDIKLSDEWSKYLLNEDGSYKKTMLYSNSAWTFLKGGYDMFDKIRDSLEVFRKNADKIALIWRPDPSTRQVLVEVRPEYVSKYDSLVSFYQEGDYGIYDTDPDFTRAVVLSDGFYGDEGGMVSIYKATGKPIMIEDLKIKSGT